MATSRKSEPQALAERFEDARLALGIKNLSDIGREIGNRSDYNLTIDRLKKGGSPTIETVERIVAFFTKRGYRREWLSYGELPKTTAEVKADTGPRYPFAKNVVEELVDEGVHPDRAKAVVFDLMFKEGAEPVTESKMYKTAKQLLAIEAGELGDGRELFAEPPQKPANPAKPRQPKKPR